MSKYDSTGRALLATTWDAIQDVPEVIEDLSALTDPGVNALVGWNTATGGLGYMSAAVMGGSPVLTQTLGDARYATLAMIPTVPAAANPATSIGLAAVNGVATTFMRSDAAPALSQAITPTWTGLHTFAATGGPALVVRGNANDASNNAYLQFTLLNGTNLGYVGDGSGGSNNLQVVSANNLELSPSATGVVNVVKSGTTQVTMGDQAGQGSLIVYGSGSASHRCHFMYGADQNVYIRQGTNTGNIYINDLVPGATTNIGNNTGHVLAVTGVILSNSDDVRSNVFYGRTSTSYNLQWAGNIGGISYGSVFISGAKNGWTGYVIGTGVYGTLMGSGSQYGLYSQGGGYWTLIDDGTTITFGKACAGPSWNSTSSRSIKRETGRIDKPREILQKLRPILYRLLNGEGGEQLGLIAEEVHEVCPQLSNGKTVAYDRLALLLLADWQENRMGEA